MVPRIRRLGSGRGGRFKDRGRGADTGAVPRADQPRGWTVKAYERIESMTLTSNAPATARRLVESLLEHRRADGRAVTDDAAARVALVASELVADAAEHGSDAATINVDVSDDSVLRVEVFDGPRRRWIVARDDDAEVTAIRARLVLGLSDRTSAHALGDAHFARCEIHYSEPRNGRHALAGW
jgi:hypothetical protein